MKTNMHSLVIAAAVALSLGLGQDPAAAQSDAFAEGRTVVAAGNNTLADHLFQEAGVLAPAQSSLWFVADTLGNGIPNSATYDLTTGTLTLGADDVILAKDVVPGSILGGVGGRYQNTSIRFNGQYAGTATYALLFNTTLPEVQWGSFIGRPGLAFGSGLVMVSPPSGLGNYRWDIDHDIIANLGSVTVVPEPAAYAVGAGFALAAFCAGRRAWARRGKSSSADATVA